MRRARLVLVAWALGAGAALAGCGQPKPPPDVPPGEVSCAEACRHVVNDLPLCGLGGRLCKEACESTARNNPKLPTCWARAQSCEELACGASQ